MFSQQKQTHQPQQHRPQRRLQPVRQQVIQRVKDFNFLIENILARATTTSTPRQIYLQTLPSTTTTRRPIVEKVKNHSVSSMTSSRSSSSSALSNIQTVVDPIILKLISKALENNEMIDEFALKQALSVKNVETTTVSL